MLKKLRGSLNSGRLVLIFAIIYVISQVIIAIILHPVGTSNVFSLQTSFSAEFMRDTLEAWRQSGVLAAYQTHFLLDFIHPAWYAIALMAGLASVFTRASIPDRWNFFLLFPLIAGVCDLIENISHVMFIGNADAITGAAVAISALAAWLKWILVVVSLVTVIAVLVGVRPKSTA